MAIDPKKIAEWRERYLRVAGSTLESRHAAALIAEALPALLAEREEMLAVLRKVEWSATRGTYEQEACPVCGAGRYDPPEPGPLRDDNRVGHAPDCRLAALLK